MSTEHTKLVKRPSPDSVNTGFTYCKPSTLTKAFGPPRAHLTKSCMSVTNPALQKLTVKGSWFGQTLWGLRHAVQSLARIEAKIREHHPELVAHMGTAGMLCARLVRGSTETPSNHSWGTAIDLTYDGKVDDRGDNMCQSWLLLVYPYFHEEGWFWGTEFSTEDSMHFELADETVKKLAPEAFKKAKAG